MRRGSAEEEERLIIPMAQLFKMMMARHIVITVAFLLLGLGGLGSIVGANQHNEYEELGIYPQREHSLTKPYQGLLILICLSY